MKSIKSKSSQNLNSISSFEINLSSNISMKIDKLERELRRLGEKREETLNRNFKYFSMKKESLKIIDFDIRIIKEKIETLREKPTSFRISLINLNKFKKLHSGIYIQRR